MTDSVFWFRAVRLLTGKKERKKENTPVKAHIYFTNVKPWIIALWLAEQIRTCSLYGRINIIIIYYVYRILYNNIEDGRNARRYINYYHYCHEHWTYSARWRDIVNCK